MKYVVTEVDVISLGKVAAIIYGAAGAIMWLFVPLFLIIPMEGGGEHVFTTGLMILFFLAAPIIQAIMGFIMGMVVGAVYNLVSRSMGGLRITLKQEV